MALTPMPSDCICQAVVADRAPCGACTRAASTRQSLMLCTVEQSEMLAATCWTIACALGSVGSRASCNRLVSSQPTLGGRHAGCICRGRRRRSCLHCRDSRATAPVAPFASELDVRPGNSSRLRFRHRGDHGAFGLRLALGYRWASGRSTGATATVCHVSRPVRALV